MTSEEMAVKLAEVEQRARSNTRRVEKLELQTEATQSIATSVEILVKEQQHQTEAMLEIKADVAKLDGKVDTLEKKPAKKWDSAVDTIVKLLLGGVVAYILTHIGL